MKDRRSQHFFIEFTIEDNPRFSSLRKLFYALRRQKDRASRGRSAEEGENPDWGAFLDDGARAWFSDRPDPESDDSRLFRQLWKLTSPEIRLTHDMFVQPGHWDFESAIGAVLDGEYQLVDIKCEGPDKGVLFYEPLAGPFGGTESLVELIEAFGSRVTFDSWHSGPHKRRYPGWDPRLARELCDRGEGFTEESARATGRLYLPIGSSWDGVPAGAHEFTSLWLISTPDRGFHIEVAAPFHCDPVPQAPPGSLDGLWRHEVVELFIAGPGEHYLEIELGPHGHHLVLAFDGIRKRSGPPLSLEFTSACKGGRWEGEATLPSSYLPKPPLRVNAYAIHGESPRRFMAHRPVPGLAPDFHQLDHFLPAELPIP